MAKLVQEFPFVVSFGAENYFLDEELQRGMHYPNRNVTVLDGAGLKGAELVDVCETPCFDSSDRVVVVDNAEKVKSDKTLKTYLVTKDVADTSVMVFVICRSDRLPDVWGSVAKKARIFEHPKLKTWDTNNEVIAYIPKMAKRLGLILDKGVPEMLYKYLGADLFKIANELRKVLVLVGKGGTATLDQVRSLCPTIFPVTVFQVVDKAIQKDAQGALIYLSFLYQNEGDESLVPLCGFLGKQLEKLAVARQMLDQKMPEDDMAIQIDMHPYRLRNFFLPIVRKHTLPNLLHAMAMTCKLDLDVKGAGSSKRTLVELAVLAVAQ